MSGCIDLEVHYPLASMGSDVIPLAKHMCSFQHVYSHITLPVVFTHL